MVGEFKGKTTGIRVLEGGKIEFSQQGMGTILGMEASLLATGTGTPMPTGVIMAEANGMVTTMNGDVVMSKISGIGWPTGKGWKSFYKGACYQMTQSPKLAALNKMVLVWTNESDENGDFVLKLWEWK